MLDRFPLDVLRMVCAYAATRHDVQPYGNDASTALTARRLAATCRVTRSACDGSGEWRRWARRRLDGVVAALIQNYYDVLSSYRGMWVHTHNDTHVQLEKHHVVICALHIVDHHALWISVLRAMGVRDDERPPPSHGSHTVCTQPTATQAKAITWCNWGVMGSPQIVIETMPCMTQRDATYTGVLAALLTTLTELGEPSEARRADHAWHRLGVHRSTPTAI